MEFYCSVLVVFFFRIIDIDPGWSVQIMEVIFVIRFVFCVFSFWLSSLFLTIKWNFVNFGIDIILLMHENIIQLDHITGIICEIDLYGSSGKDCLYGPTFLEVECFDYGEFLRDQHIFTNFIFIGCNVWSTLVYEDNSPFDSFEMPLVMELLANLILGWLQTSTYYFSFQHFVVFHVNVMHNQIIFILFFWRKLFIMEPSQIYQEVFSVLIVKFNVDSLIFVLSKYRIRFNRQGSYLLLINPEGFTLFFEVLQQFFGREHNFSICVGFNFGVNITGFEYAIDALSLPLKISTL